MANLMLWSILLVLYLMSTSTFGETNALPTNDEDSLNLQNLNTNPWSVHKDHAKRNDFSTEDEVEDRPSREQHSHRHQHGAKNHLHDATAQTYLDGIESVTADYSAITDVDNVNDIEESLKELENVVAKTIENNNQSLTEEFDIIAKENAVKAENSNQLIALQNEIEKEKLTSKFDSSTANSIDTTKFTYETTEQTPTQSQMENVPRKALNESVDDYSTTIFYSENVNLSKSTYDQGLQSASLVTENVLDFDRMMRTVDSTTSYSTSARTTVAPVFHEEEHNYDDEYEDEDEDSDTEGESKIPPEAPANVINETEILTTEPEEEVITRNNVSSSTETTFIVTTTTTERPTTTTTEVTEIVDPNNPPVIKSRIQKILATAGKYFNVHIPAETFWDKEDGTNLKLELIDRNGNPLRPTSWIQFDSEKGNIYGLPLEDSVSRWQYKISAIDKENASVTEMFDISVHQHKGHRSVNHEINLNVHLEKEFKNNIDWQIMLMRNIAKVLGDDTISMIVVREIRYNNLDPKSISFIYTNDSFPKDKCPEEQLGDLLTALSMTKLNHELNGEIVVKMINGGQVGSCEKIIRVPKPTEVSRNFPPLTRNQVDRLNATVGQLLIFKVPSDTFYDPEDGIHLKITLLNSERSALEPQHWLQFDTKNQEFFGIPKAGDLGQKEYFLVAEDKEGLSVTDALIVCVEHATKRDYSVLFEMTLGIPYESFNNSNTQRRFVERLAALFQDSSTSNILVRSIRHIHHSGNTLITFFNITLHRINNKCPESEINRIRNILLHQDSSIRDNVKDSIGLEFNIQKINLVPIGTCQGFETYHHDLVPPVKPDHGDMEVYKEDYLLTYIFPTCIILVMLLISFIITCILYKRRQTGKVELGDEEERISFRSKGIPVIFQDELDEKPDLCNKHPIILKNEKPPLLTHYNGMTSEGEHDSLDEYKPPPGVISAGRENRGKSPLTPSYRKPPPYVSP